MERKPLSLRPLLTAGSRVVEEEEELEVELQKKNKIKAFDCTIGRETIAGTLIVTVNTMKEKMNRGNNDKLGT